MKHSPSRDLVVFDFKEEDGLPDNTHPQWSNLSNPKFEDPATKYQFLQYETGGMTSQETASEDLQITCFTDVIDDATVHFQIIHLKKQIYAWIGCNSGKLGPLYAAAPTRPNNTVSVTSILGGTSDNTGSGIARRLVLRTGLNIILACNVPKNNPMLEIGVEKKLVEKLISLGYTKARSKDQPHS